MDDQSEDQSVLGAAESPCSQRNTQALCRIHIVHGGVTLQTLCADPESLEQNSRFFKARLSSNWCSTSSSSSHQQQQQVEVQLHVRQPDHASMAAALVRYLDGGELPPHLQSATAAAAAPNTTSTSSGAANVGKDDDDSNTSNNTSNNTCEAAAVAAVAQQRDLLLLAHLADQYQVPQLISHVLRVLLHLLSLQRPSWQVVLFLLQGVQDSLSCHPSFAAAHRLARAYALRQLRDLEAVVGDEGRCGVLACLPYEVLLQLVGSCDTAVAYESTVVEAISTWLHAQPPGCVCAPQLAQLASKVRFRGLPRCYLMTVLPHVHWYTTGAGQGVISQAVMFLQPLDMMRQQQAASATATAATTTTTPNTSSGSGSGSSSSAVVSPQEVAESKALGVVLERQLRGSDFWVNTLLAPRAKSSSTQQLVLTADLSRARLAAAYNNINSSSNGGSNGGSSAWQLTRGGSGVFAGMQWTLWFRFVSTRSCCKGGRGSAGGGGGGRGCCTCRRHTHQQQQQRQQQHQQQQQPVIGTKRRQREFIEQEQAAAAAMMAAAAAEAAAVDGNVGLIGSAALLEQVMLDSLLQQGGEPPHEQQHHHHHHAAAAAAASPASPPRAAAAAGIGNDAAAAGSGSGGPAAAAAAAAAAPAQLCSGKINWQLQFGVSFSVPYLQAPTTSSAAAPGEQDDDGAHADDGGSSSNDGAMMMMMPPPLSLMLVPPSLQHRLARAPSSSSSSKVYPTRGQKARSGGFDASRVPRLLEAGEVLPCVELLPLMLPGNGGGAGAGSNAAAAAASSSSGSCCCWDEECDRRLAAFVDGDGRLRASTCISDIN